MSEEDINFLISIQDLEQPEFDNACLERENKRLTKEIKRLNNIIIELSEKNRNLIEDTMRLRKELNLHAGKLYISDKEVKNVWK